MSSQIKIVFMKQITILIITLLLGGCSTGPNIVHSSNINILSSKKVSIVNHGWHTGFVVPSATITKQLPQLEERFNNIPFIEFGWGDKGFYQAKEITSGLTLQAIFWPTKSVIHAVAVPELAEKYFNKSEVKTICLQNKQYATLISFIKNSFYTQNDGNIIPLKKGIYGNSQFYKGKGDYHLMNTCNKWTAKGLSSAGMDISPTFKLTAGSIMSYLSTQKEYEINNPYECVK